MTFDLEKAIAAWRRSFRHRRVFLADDLEELERHIRDHTARLVAQGLSEEAAFRTSVRRVGDRGAMEGEYRKVFWAKVKHRRNLLREIKWEVAMFSNYWKVALRTLRKHKGYSLINVAGLAVGLAGCVLLLLFVQDELRYDRHHEKADRIFRVVFDARFGGDEIHDPVTAAPMARMLEAEFPEVEAATRLEQADNTIVRRGDLRFRENRFFYADSSVFDVMTIAFVRGSEQTALTEPNSVVLSESMASKYFGTADPLGELLEVNGDDYRITGVVADAPPQTHWHFDFIASFVSRPYSDATGWVPLNYYTYVALRRAQDQKALEAKLPDLVRTHMSADIAQVAGTSYEAFLARGDYIAFFLQPVTAIHLRSHFDAEIEPNGDITYVYLLGATAALLLLIACVNFMNLATARSSNRAREVGMRKVLGSYRRQLVQQFLGESVLLTFIASIVAVGLVLLCLPAFNALVHKDLDTQFLYTGWFWLGIGALGVGVGVLAGSYPALVLSSFPPLAVLKGKSGGASGRSRLRSGLVVFQFAVSIALIVGALVVRDQLAFVQNARLGFDKEHVVVVQGAGLLGSQREAFKQAILEYADVERASAALLVPGGFSGTNAYQKLDDDRTFGWQFFSVDEDYLETLNVNLIAGRDFGPGFTADAASVLINNAAARALGWEDPVGKKLRVPDVGAPYPLLYTVVGVVQDFHYESLHNQIAPIVIHPLDVWGNARVLAVRIRPDRVQETLADIENTWEAFAPGEPFRYSFLDQDIAGLYRTEQQTGLTFGIFAALAILVACLGLFGMAAFMAERRTKEIGVRKVLGATVIGLVAWQSREFVKFVGIAFLLAVPVAWLLMTRWLQTFALRIELSWSVFLLAGLAALIIALLTVSYQSVKAATANPVRSLRYE